MGAVYEAVHLETGRRRALKVMHPHILDRPELRVIQAESGHLPGRPARHSIVEAFDADDEGQHLNILSGDGAGLKAKSG